MVNVYVLRNLDQVKAIADPLRISILNLLCTEAMTTKQVSLALKLPVHKLYHHVETLEEAHLIKMVRTQPNRGTLEKYFQAVAKHFTLSPTLFEVRLKTKPTTEKDLTVSAIFQNALEEIKISLSQNVLTSDSKFLSNMEVRLTPDKATHLQVKLQEWLDECRDSDTETSPQKFGITTAFYPKV